MAENLVGMKVAVMVVAMVGHWVAWLADRKAVWKADQTVGLMVGGMVELKVA